MATKLNVTSRRNVLYPVFEGSWVHLNLFNFYGILLIQLMYRSVLIQNVSQLNLALCKIEFYVENATDWVLDLLEQGNTIKNIITILPSKPLIVKSSLGHFVCSMSSIREIRQLLYNTETVVLGWSLITRPWWASDVNISQKSRNTSVNGVERVTNYVTLHAGN